MQEEVNLPEDVRWIVERMSIEEKTLFNAALDAFDDSGIPKEDYAANLIEQGFPEPLVRWGLNLKQSENGPSAGSTALAEVGQKIIDAGKEAWQYLTSPPTGGTSQPDASVSGGQVVGAPPLPGPTNIPPPPNPPPPTAGTPKASRQHQVRYTATIFGMEAGCQNKGTWNRSTINRYTELLNRYAEQGWHLLRMDVIPFSSGCWPFIQTGNIYLLTFQSR